MSLGPVELQDVATSSLHGELMREEAMSPWQGKKRTCNWTVQNCGMKTQGTQVATHHKLG